jgi:hypothetical protein
MSRGSNVLPSSLWRALFDPVEVGVQHCSVRIGDGAGDGRHFLSLISRLACRGTSELADPFSKSADDAGANELING